MKKSILSTMAAMPPPPPPPPPSKSPRKSLTAILLVVIVVVALIVGIYLATSGMGTNNSVTPTATPSSGVMLTPIGGTTPTPTSSGTAANIAGASSLQFTVSITNSSGGTSSSYTYSANKCRDTKHDDKSRVH